MTRKKRIYSKTIYYYLNFFATLRTILSLFFIYVLVMLLCGTSTKTALNEEYPESYHFPVYSRISETIQHIFNKEELKHIEIEVVDEGKVLYEPVGSGYRYGPSILMNEDGTMHAYFASNANNSEWDWITYRYFDGENWSNEKIVLQPTGNSLDYYSTCDPGVFYYDGYYYLGYTSTINAKDGGIDNDIFVARSTSPTGPFEKWNGEGWGGDPYPIIDYNGSPDYWGAGEISFVIYKEQLYCYYSWYSENSYSTRLSVANLCDNWPATLIDKGEVIGRYSGQDSVDVCYFDEYNLFVAFATYNRFNYNSGIIVYQSKNGVDFVVADYTSEDVAKYCHNLGISKRGDGHIQKGDSIYLGYAYAQAPDVWGKWALRIQKIKTNLLFGKVEENEESPTLYPFTNTTNNRLIIGINVEPRTIKLNVGNSRSISLYAYNGNLKRSAYNKSVNYEYDENIIQINKNGTMKAVGSGECNVLIYNDDFYTTLKVIVR